jgi:ATP synthase subunit 6
MDFFLYLFLTYTYWNISIFRTLVFIIFLFYLAYGTPFRFGGFVWPRMWQSFIEVFYKFLASIFKDQVGYRGQVYFPFLSTVFIYVFFLNIFGMIPYEGAITSQLIFNLSLSFSLLFMLTIIGLIRQKQGFLKLFLPPKGVPSVLIPLIIFIECVSYIARGISLGVRLFANIMAGHTLLFIFSSFILKVNVILALCIFLIIFLVTFLEFFIASLQAYVFYVLTVMYFRDSIEVSH